MTWEISKDFAFEASHHLDGLPDGHQCGRLHGHSYRVRVTLIGDALDQYGFILDYGRLKVFGQWIDTNLDHQYLNEVLPIQPSAENMAHHLHDVLLGLVRIPDDVTATVGVSETQKTWATYWPDPE